MTVKQAAERLELSYKSVYRLVESGQLGCQRIGPGEVKISIQDHHIEQYRQSCERRGSMGVAR